MRGEFVLESKGFEELASAEAGSDGEEEGDEGLVGASVDISVVSEISPLVVLELSVEGGIIVGGLATARTVTFSLEGPLTLVDVSMTNIILIRGSRVNYW